MQKMSQTVELARLLAARARRHTLTPEEIGRAMDEQEYDAAGLDALHAALEARGVTVKEEDPTCPRWMRHRSGGWNTSSRRRAWRWMIR